MKHLFFTFILAFLAINSAMAQMPMAKVRTIDGENLLGYYLAKSDSTISIKVTTNTEYYKQNTGSDVVTLPIKQVNILKLDNQYYLQERGQFIPVSSKELKQRTMVQDLNLNVNSPNYILGKALKSSGDVALAVGIPCLATGFACMIAGHTMRVHYSDDLFTKADLLETGYYLFPIGASLTIIGIPLHMHGKKIMEMNINYTGNGAGLALKF